MGVRIVRHVVTGCISAALSLALVTSAGCAGQSGRYKAEFISYETGPANTPAARVLVVDDKGELSDPEQLVECRVDGLKRGDLVWVERVGSASSYANMSEDTVISKVEQ